MSPLSALKSSLVSATRNKAVGVPAAIIAQRFGMLETSRKISTMCEYVPRWTPVQPPHGARSFVMNSADGTDMVARSLWWGGWHGFEKPMPDIFARLAAEPGVVLDIGAYSGFYSLVAASTRPTAKIFAFEPFASVRAILNANIARNNLETVVTVCSMALSNKSGEAALVSPKSSTGLVESASSIQPDVYGERAAASEIVETAPLDALRESLIGERVSLIKLDVEAHEPAVLEGALRTISDDRPFLFMEILGKADVRSLQPYFDKAGYRNAFLHNSGVTWRREIRNEGKFWNHILCPEEKTDFLKNCVGELGLSSDMADEA